MKVFGLPSNSYVKIANSSDFYTLESLFFARLAEISGIRWCEITLHQTMEACVSGLNSLPGDILPIGSIKDHSISFSPP